MKAIADLKTRIEEANDLYRKGNPIMTDQEYDSLVEELYKLDPDNIFFKKGINDKVKSDRKEKLPIPMYSLEKVKTFEEIKRWIFSCGIDSFEKLIITPKYDGISLCVNEVVGDAWTRGDGEYGQNCSNYFMKMKNSVFNFQGSEMPITYSFGEAIFRTKDFLEIKEEAGYKSARNAVAGIINSSEILTSILSRITYVRYGCDKEDWNKQLQLDYLNESGLKFLKVNYVQTSVGSLISNETTFVNLMNRIFEEITQDYKCDGLVIDIDDADTRKRLGRLPNGNPKYAIAYKNPDWSEREETIVKNIEWQVSKDGRLAPVVNIEPVELCGATVSKCTAYNARYVKDNFLGKGARILIARSGDVIPKHLKTIKSSGNYNQILPHICPICGHILSKNEIDLVCKNENCDGIRLAKCIYFFSILDFKEFREPTIKKIFNYGYKDPFKILELDEDKLKKIEGIGNVAAKVLSKQFEEFRKKGTNFAKFLTACNYFKGRIAEKTCQKILNGLKLYSYQDVCNYAYECDESWALEIDRLIEGVGVSTGLSFISGLIEWYKDNSYLIHPITYYGLEEKKFDGQMTVVFTGFRDKSLEKQLTDQGHKIGSSVSKKTTCLIVKERGSGSTKEQKAEQLGIPIYTLQEFKEKLSTL